MSVAENSAQRGPRIVPIAPSTHGRFATVNTKNSLDPFFYKSFDRTLHRDLKHDLAPHIARFPKVPIAIVELFEDGTRGVFAHRPTETHYVASMAKIAAVYAAFALRERLRIFARAQPAGKGVLKHAARHFNPRILAAAKKLTPLQNASDTVLLPQYEIAFRPANDGRTVEFHSNFEPQLNKIHDNGPAGQVIHGIGYGYINAQLHRAKFADTSSREGIWLAGDYLDEKEKGTRADKYPAYRVPSVNTGTTAQGASAEASALLFAMMMTNEALKLGVRTTASKAGNPGNEFIKAFEYENSSWIHRNWVSPEWNRVFDLRSAKPGRSETSGRILRSDASYIRSRKFSGRRDDIVKRITKEREFVLVFQNVQVPRGVNEDAFGRKYARSLLAALRPYLES